MYAEAVTMTASEETMRDVAEGQGPGPGREKGAGQGHDQGIAGRLEVNVQNTASLRAQCLRHLS